MKRFGIVTLFYKNYNYGGMLQAYALQNCLRGMGVDNDVLQLEYKEHAASFRSRQKKKTSRPPSLYQRIQGWATLIALAKRKKRFDRFVQEWIQTSDVLYTDENIRDANQRYDGFITGSDQVWNPKYGSDSMLLDFVDDSHRKISYAASFGVADVSQEYLDYAVPLIDRLDAVSVREPSGAKLLAGRVRQQVCCVLDPTLLLSREQWETLCRPPKGKKEYVFLYLLGGSAQQYRIVRAAMDKLSVPGGG